MIMATYKWKVKHILKSPLYEKLDKLISKTQQRTYPKLFTLRLMDEKYNIKL